LGENYWGLCLEGGEFLDSGEKQTSTKKGGGGGGYDCDWNKLHREALGDVCERE